MSERTLSYPFTIQYGAAVATSNYRKVWADRVLSAVGTALGERPMRDTYGTTFAKTLWANTEEAAEIANEQIPVAFQKHLPYLSLDGVQVYQVAQDDLDGEYLEVEITYVLPSGEEVTSSAVVGTLDFRGDFAGESYDFPADTGNELDDDIEVDF